MEKVLIVEDDHLIGQQLCKFLKHQNYEVVWLKSGEYAVETVRTASPNLILLDIMLPVKDGITCCKEIRGFSNIPIIMLTAKVEEIERIIGLQAGADDYVCKPFSAQELILRIKAILKRSSHSTFINKLQLDQDKLTVSLNTDTIELSQIEFALLNLLYQYPQRVFSRDQILNLAYPDDRNINDRAIDSQVKNIRKKIKPLNIQSNVIESIYGVGYRYAPENS